MISNGAWHRESLCAQPEYAGKEDLFFSEDPDEIAEAKSICNQCDVRLLCLKSALDNKEIFGVWGGIDEEKLRIVLSVDEEGQEVRRIRKGEAPVCPNCEADTGDLRTEELSVPGGGRWTTKKDVSCTKCGFSWTSRSSANAVESYLALKARKN
ncbi:MAG: WhiB family transcriptional regulator [Cetobacterium sp.]